MADLTNDTTSTSFYQIKFTVRGHVMKPDGSTVAGITVKAFDKDIDQEKIIGTTVSGTNGLYIINFTSADLSRPDKASPDLIVRGYDSEGKLVAASPLITGLTSAEEIVILRIGTIESPEPPVPEPPFVVMGKVQHYDGLPFKNGVVRAFHVNVEGAIRLGEDTTDGEGQYTISYEIPLGALGINLRVTVTDEENRLLQSSEVIYKAKSLEVVNLTVPATIQPAVQHRLEGRIVFNFGLPAEQIALRLYSHGFGGTETMLGETVTGKYGLYALSFDAGSRTTGLEVRAVNATGEEVSLSRPLYDLSEGERTILNLVAPASLRPLPAEYQRLAIDLMPHVGQMSQLVSAVENAEQRDLSFLNRATGWDARLIALAANAAKLSVDQEVGLSQEVLYGLFRAGLPSDKLKLAQVRMEVVEQALAKSREIGIIELSDDQMTEARNQFETFACGMRLSIPAPGSHSTYNDMLKATGLSDDTCNKFASVYFNHHGDAAQLWEKAAAVGIDPNDIPILQTQGKLAFLTCNSAAMTTRLQHGLGISDPVELIDHGFYRADKWDAEIRALAGNDEQKLQALIPPAYEGKTVDDRLKAYTADMVRIVRLSYPTQVIGHMVETDSVDAFKLGASGPYVATLLKSAANEGFKLGQTPVEPFFDTHPEVLNCIDPSVVESAKQGMKTVQCIYQISPDFETMPILLGQGFTSAFDVAAIPYDTFMSVCGHQFSSPEQADLVYRKASEEVTLIYNWFTLGEELKREVAVSAISGPVEEREAVRNELIKRFPTMESLFGSLDFCECQHCRSVLSPAAYLVDLLKFLDPDDKEWQASLDRWKNEHNGQKYTDKYKRPYDALIERRPDLPYIPLTCENTHTALPYIDVVNEILEYYVANNRLDDKAAHDTGNATTPELLAEPQNVLVEAYNRLNEACYPLILPFDLWLEMVRRFTDYFETPLWRILEVFRPGDKLFAPTQTYDRAAIFAEQLGLSSAEYAIFTDSNPLDKWHELYGYEKPEEATTVSEDADGQRIDLNSAKTLSRRLGVTYKELVEIIKTGFVNPQLEALVILYKLGVTISDVLFYRDYKGLLNQNPNTLSQDNRKRLNELKAFERRLDDMSQTFQAVGFNARDWLNTALQNKAFDDILVLADLDTGCNFDQTILRYARVKDADADDMAFLKINLFVRLWRKLGWSIEETDRALQAFVPKNAPFERAHLSKQPLKTALIYLAHLNALDKQLNIGKQSRLKLITLWSQMATTGNNPLYAQLFLTRSVLKSDPVFDDPLGNYVSPASLAAMAQSQWHEVSLQNVAPADKIDPGAFSGEPQISLNYDVLQKVQHLAYQGKLTDTKKAQLIALSPSPVLPLLLNKIQKKVREFSLIKGHLPALQGALGLTADEIGRILKDAGKSIESAELSIDHVSLLYRYALLAKALGLSISELIELKELSGLNPFKPLSEDPLSKDQEVDIAEDYPFSQTLRFVKVAEQVKESGFKIEDLGYLLRHRFDPTGKYRPDSEAMLALMKTLAEGIRAIRAEHAVPEDAGAMDEDTLRQKLGLVLLPEVVERFLAMMNGTAEFTATKSGVPPEAQLNPEDFADELSIRQVTYNETREEQKLTFRGVLFDAQKDKLKAQYPSSVFSDLLDDVQAQAEIFFEKHLQKQVPDFQPAFGFLEEADFDLLFSPIPDDWTDMDKQNKVRERRTKLAQAFLPFLQQQLIRQFIIQTMTAQTGADPALVEALLTDTQLLGYLRLPDNPGPLLEAFTAIDENGLTATFFASSDGSGEKLATLVFADADTALKDKDGNPIKPDGANSVRFEGYLEVKMPGAYRFYVAFEREGTEAELRFDHMPEPLLSDVADSDGSEISDYLELKPGVPYRFTLQIRNLGGGEACLLVQGETLPKDSLGQLTLYPQDAIERADHARILLTKALQLIQGFNLNEREVRYLLTHATDFDNLNLSSLPVQESDDTPEGAEAARALFAQFLRLAGYAQLKRDLAGGTDDLIGIFETKTHEAVYPLIATLTRRNEETVEEAAESVLATSDFSNELDIQRLWEVLQIVERFGVPIVSIAGWTRIVNTSATPHQRFAIACDLKQAIKALFEPETWQRVAQPIFDKLRQRQRDALVAHVMHQHEFARMEQLYEYFLIDPGMEPVVQTTRIRLTIASVQLFIQRCLLNLEEYVPPSIINAKQWEWMKRYRVWEANRKIFLFPENWLEPEFRDDKTHLFSELEGNLLQGDVTRDLVEDAFLNYLKKLDEMAQLEIVGMYWDYKANEVNTLHVIGRTYNTPYKYFYRRCSNQVWTPWEPVTAEIEGDHLAPVVWRDRLYLFWVTFMDKPDESAQLGDKTQQNLSKAKLPEIMSDLKEAGKTKKIDVQLHWSEYLQGKWSTRQSSGFFPMGRVLSVASDADIKKLDPKIQERIIEIPPYKHFLLFSVPLKFDPRNVFIYVSKNYGDGEERGVYIHLEGWGIEMSFCLAGRNSSPEMLKHILSLQPPVPYSYTVKSANRYSGSGPLTVTFPSGITTEDGKEPKKPSSILQEGNRYTMLHRDNIVTLGTPEIATSFVSPFFYQDNTEHTFFVEPTLYVKRIDEWEDWLIYVAEPKELRLELKDYLDYEPWPMIPELEQPIPIDRTDNNIWDVNIDESIFQLAPKEDWLVNPVTVVQFNGELIGPGGYAGLIVVPLVEDTSVLAVGGMKVNIHTGSNLEPNSTIVLKAGNSLKQAGLTQAAGGLNIVGSSGFNPALAQNIKSFNGLGFGVANFGTGLNER